MTRTVTAVVLACVATMGFAGVWRHYAADTHSATAVNLSANARQNALRNYGNLPLIFEENTGQTAAQVRFLAHGSGYTIFLTDQAATLRFDTSGKSGVSHDSSAEKSRSLAVRFALAHSNRHPKVHGEDPLPGHSNYLVGNDPTKWHRGVSQFGRVQLDSVYPGIDLAYYGNQGRLESDYIVAPGADTQQIAVRIEGADRVKIDSSGNAIVESDGGELPLLQPIAYQNINGSRQTVASNYVQRGPNLFGIQVGPYDLKHTLVIDPVVGYGTFLSGANGTTFGNSIAVDSLGDAVVVGSTDSTSFPVTAGVFQNASKGTTQPTGYISKLNGAGSALLFSTYLGGSGSPSRGDTVSSVAIDASGNVLVVGTTSSSDFPTTSGGLQIINKNNFSSGFLSKLDPTGSTLLYSTYLGGSVGDNSTSVALDSNGNAYVTGFTSSNDFPTTPATAIQTATKTGNPTAYVTRINTTLSGPASLIYSTLLGGSSGETGTGIAVDANFNAYITGTTKSTDFPVTSSNAFQTTIKGTAGNAFLAQIDTTTPSNLVYSTFLGGTATAREGDSGAGIALDKNFNAYIIGTDVSPDFPSTAGAFQTSPPNNVLTVFVARLDTTKLKANSLIYSTFLGGTNADLPGGIAVDPNGNAYLTGTTESRDFPILPGAPQPIHTGATDNPFVSVLDPTGSFLVFSTFYGGNNGDFGNAIAIDSATVPNVYFTGITASANFPVTPNAFQATFKTAGAYVVKLSPGAATGVLLAPVSLNFGTQIVRTASAAQIVTLANLTKSAISINGISFIGTNASDFAQSNSTCSGTIAIGKTCTIGVIFTPSTTAAESATLSVADTDSSSPQTVTLAGTGTAPPSAVFLSPTTGSFGNQAIGQASTAQTFTLTNSGTTTASRVAVSITGTSAASFAQTTTCGTTLAAGANCAINVTFKPTAAGAASATLSVADSDPSSPQTAVLTGTGTTTTPDFTIAVSPTTATVAAGSPSNVTVTVVGLNSFTDSVALTCSGAPVDSTCTLNPTSVTPTPTGATSAAAITTAARTTPAASIRIAPRPPSGVWPASLAISMLSLVCFACWTRRTSTVKKLAWTFAALMAISLTSCSGLPATGTPAGTYTITITGTSGTLTHSATVTLTVT